MMEALQIARYGAAGAVTSALSYLVYVVLLYVLNPVVSYTCAFAAGLVLSFGANSKFVFQKSINASTATRFVGVYVLQYIVGAVALTGLTAQTGIRADIAGLLVMAGNAVIGYLLLKAYVYGHQ